MLCLFVSSKYYDSFSFSFFLLLSISSCFGWQAIDHIINSAAKSNYMSAGQISVPIVFRGPNGAAAGVGAQHSHVWFLRLYFCA